MKHFSLVLVCVLSNNALAAAPMTVMSFNVRWGNAVSEPSGQENAWVAATGLHRRDLARQLVAEGDPDILCLQEALKHQVEDLQGALPDHVFYGVGRDDGVEKGEYCGIFFRRDRFTKSDQGNFWLNEDSDQPGTRFPGTCCARLATWVLLKDKQTNHREFLLLNTHWDHQVQAARLFSSKLIRSKLKSLASERPLLLTGDLNVPTDNQSFQLLVNATSENPIALLDSYRKSHPQPEKEEGTFHAFRGNTDGPRIDYVLHSQSFRTQQADIVRMHEKSRYPSDHYPVTATLVLVE